ncbi:MAG: MOSC domain-containing protein, partial [Clostridiales bacterium]|nr:MOSC domain-containing protein [Clostridiales bacterium]
MRQGVIRAICVSSARGTEKHEITQGRLVENWGLEGDAHGGDWHRQISLLSLARVEAFNA